MFEGIVEPAPQQANMPSTERCWLHDGVRAPSLLPEPISAVLALSMHSSSQGLPSSCMYSCSRSHRDPDVWGCESLKFLHDPRSSALQAQELEHVKVFI